MNAINNVVSACTSFILWPRPHTTFRNELAGLTTIITNTAAAATTTLQSEKDAYEMMKEKDKEPNLDTSVLS